MKTPRINALSDLHPQAYTSFLNLNTWLKIHSPFAIFETLRTPEAQRLLFLDGKTKAQPWYSAHQYGLAVDFVPIVNGKWSWNVETATWDILRDRATRCGLICNLDWDRCHVEHPLFRIIRSTW